MEARSRLKQEYGLPPATSSAKQEQRAQRAHLDAPSLQVHRQAVAQQEVARHRHRGRGGCSGVHPAGRHNEGVASGHIHPHHALAVRRQEDLQSSGAACDLKRCWEQGCAALLYQALNQPATLDTGRHAAPKARVVLQGPRPRRKWVPAHRRVARAGGPGCVGGQVARRGGHERKGLGARHHVAPHPRAAAGQAEVYEGAGGAYGQEGGGVRAVGRGAGPDLGQQVGGPHAGGGLDLRLQATGGSAGRAHTC